MGDALTLDLLVVQVRASRKAVVVRADGGFIGSSTNLVRRQPGWGGGNSQSQPVDDLFKVAPHASADRCLGASV